MEKKFKKLQMVGQVGVDPTMPVAADLQSAPFADSVLTHMKLEEHTETSGGSTLSIRPEIALCRYSSTHVLFLQPIGVFLLRTSAQWSSQPDLNWRPHPYQGCALPTELCEHLGDLRHQLHGFFKSPYRLLTFTQ